MKQKSCDAFRFPLACYLLNGRSIYQKQAYLANEHITFWNRHIFAIFKY